jgi:4-amino-4-deoxy-L-arabinose transferase-like glycosyltransferase
MVRAPRRWDGAPLIFTVIAGVAFIVRIVAIVWSRLANPYEIHGDALLYDEIARSILSGGGFARAGHQTGIVTPGYPVFLAGVYAVAGHGTFLVAIAQAVLGAATAGMIGLIALRLAGPVAAYAAGAIAALYPHFVIWTEQLLTETLFVFLGVVALWLLVEAQGRTPIGWTVGAAAALAAASLVRSEMLAFVPLAALISWLGGRHEGRWVRAGALVALPALAIGLWTVRNAETVGVASPATESATVLWIAFNPEAPRLHTGGYAYAMPLADPPPDDATEAAVYARYSQAVSAELRAHPEVVITYMPAKLGNMWRPVFDGSKLLTWIGFGGSYVVTMLLAVIGLVALWRRGAPAGSWYAFAYIASLTGVHAVTIAEIRYRMPVEAALIVLAGVGAAVVLERAVPRVRSRIVRTPAIS